MLSRPNYLIHQADGQTVGSNSFQSLGKFGLNIGESATLANFVSLDRSKFKSYSKLGTKY